LAQQGVDVVVLEAGARFKISDFQNDERAAYDMFTWKDPRIVTGESRVARENPTFPTWVCKAVGGSTIHWAGQSLRLRDHEFRPRTTYGAIAGTSLIDWPIDLAEMAPFYARAEDKMGVSGRGGRPALPGNNNYKVFARGAKRLGYRDYDVSHMAINSAPYDGRNACDQIGFCMQGCASGAKWSTLYTEIPKAEATGRCEVRPNAMALQLLLDARGSVSGVLYADDQGVQHLQKARAVCVAGNSIETPRLLLNSATGAFPDGLANSSGQVGKNYVRNAQGYVYGLFERPVHMHRGVAAAGIVRDESHHDPARGFAAGLLMTTCGVGLGNYAAALDPRGWGRVYAATLEHYERTAGIWIAGEDMPMAKNGVTLHATERDRFGLPVPVVNIDEHPNDVATINYGQRKAADLLVAAGAWRTVEPPPVPASHNLGTCRMSGSADQGVVDRWGRAHDIANLYVSDGSQFASSFVGNPTLTIVALAIRQAEHIAEAMRRGDL
jgi:choline dehydrogenase-like flavoprotein